VFIIYNQIGLQKPLEFNETMTKWKIPLSMMDEKMLTCGNYDYLKCWNVTFGDVIHKWQMVTICIEMITCGENTLLHTSTTNLTNSQIENYMNWLINMCTSMLIKNITKKVGHVKIKLSKITN
jgi:hypothetical protein